MLRVDRANYCNSRSPYRDEPYSIAYGATISAPHMHAFALEALREQLVEGARVLDVGSGSGYLSACFAHMIGPTGKVFGVEHIKELVTISKANLHKGSPELLDEQRVEILRKFHVHSKCKFQSRLSTAI